VALNPSQFSIHEQFVDVFWVKWCFDLLFETISVVVTVEMRRSMESNEAHIAELNERDNMTNDMIQIPKHEPKHEIRCEPSSDDRVEQKGIIVCATQSVTDAHALASIEKG
jgi:hypothetical protein